MTITVRPSLPDDMPELVVMLRELAEFERAPAGSLRCTEADFRRDGFGPQRRFDCLFAEDHGAVAGFIILLPSYSSWLALPGLIIHDLYVRPQARGKGAATALVAAARALADERGCGRMDVNVLSWNSASAFYTKQGFAPQPDWVIHRLDLPQHRKDRA
jgi:GNAT superfamily N-acetyltransferase